MAKAAAALIVVLSKPTFTPPGAKEPVTLGSASFDAGAAWASLAFQALELGWATHGMGGFDAEAARRVVHAPADYRVEAVIAIGKRGDPTELPESLRMRETPTQRRPLAEIAFEATLPSAEPTPIR